MSCRGSKGRTASQAFDNALKFVAARNDYAQRNRPKFKEQPEVVEIPVIKWAFVVPLDFESYPVFEAIDFVCRAF